MSRKLLLVLIVLGVVTLVGLTVLGIPNFLGFNIIGPTSQTSMPNMSGSKSVGSNLGPNIGMMPDYISGGKPIVPPNDTYYPPPVTGGGDALDVNQRVYSKSSVFSFVVSDLTKYVSGMTNYLLTVGGRILSSQVSSQGRYNYAYLVAKVPADKFDEVNVKVKDGVKKIMAENVNSLDETGSYVATTTKLDGLNQQKLDKEKALLEAKTDVERKQIQLEIDRLNIQIKQAEVEVKNVTAQTSYATVTLTVSDSERYFKGTNSPEPDLRQIFDDAVANVGKTLILVAALMIQVAVYAILWLPVLLLVRFLFFKKKTQPK